jgi:rhodanese-related sulfurtransferase
MFSFLKNLFSTTNYANLLEKGAIIIDVRTGPEYDAGHLPKAKNIPLDRVNERVVELKSKNVPVICCCASGMRSAVASKLLKNNGIEAYNGGSWNSLGRKLGLL